MRKNPFKEIYLQCNQAENNMQKYQMILDGTVSLPRYLDIELTNYCNFKCVFCPTGTNSIKRQKGYMDQKVLDAICSNIKKYHIPGVRLIRWGEPMLHPECIDIIKKLKETGPIVHINTNGSLLTFEKMQQLICVGLDSIKFSFQGADEDTYKEMRSNLSGNGYHQLLNCIRQLYELRGDSEVPYIQISTTLTDENIMQIEQFKHDVEGICDYFNIGYTELKHLDIDKMDIDPTEKEKIRRIQERENIQHKNIDICPEVFDKLSINWNGDVTLCCSDYDDFMIVGNILHQDLKDIFNGQKADSYRKIISKNEYGKIPICSTCYEKVPLIKS